MIIKMNHLLLGLSLIVNGFLGGLLWNGQTKVVVVETVPLTGSFHLPEAVPARVRGGFLAGDVGFDGGLINPLLPGFTYREATGRVEFELDPKFRQFDIPLNPLIEPNQPSLPRVPPRPPTLQRDLYPDSDDVPPPDRVLYLSPKSVGI